MRLTHRQLAENIVEQARLAATHTPSRLAVDVDVDHVINGITMALESAHHNGAEDLIADRLSTARVQLVAAALQALGKMVSPDVYADLAVDLADRTLARMLAVEPPK